MKTAILLVSAAGLAAAQNLAGQPACATPCLSSAISAVCTPASDQACACASQTAVASLAVACLLSSCDSDDLVVAQSAGNAICLSYSATATGGSAAPTTTPTGATNSTSTITSSASLTSSTAGSSSSESTATSAATGSAASASSTAGAAYVQGSTVAGAGVLGMFLAAVAAL